jgi:hypothetical protein
MCLSFEKGKSKSGASGNRARPIDCDPNAGNLEVPTANGWKKSFNAKAAKGKAKEAQGERQVLIVERKTQNRTLGGFALP